MEYLEHKAVWFPGSARIAGVRLSMPTLGQLRLLEAVASPFLVGGEAGPVDVALALYILATPWRRARKALASPLRMDCAVVWLRLRRLRGDSYKQAAPDLADFVNRALWTPERYIRDGAAAAFRPASGLATRLAVRAAQLGLAALCHGRRGSWDCVWDVPVDAMLCYSVGFSETDGAEYTTRAEMETIGSGPPAASPAPPALTAPPGEMQQPDAPQQDREPLGGKQSIVESEHAPSV